MSEADSRCDGEQPRAFPLVPEDTVQGELRQEPDTASTVGTVQHEKHVPDQEHGEPVETGNNVEADDFLHPREVILAREAIRIRHGRKSP